MSSNQEKANEKRSQKRKSHPSITDSNDDVVKTKAVGVAVSGDSGTDVGHVSSDEDSDVEASVVPDICAQVYSLIALD